MTSSLILLLIDANASTQAACMLRGVQPRTRECMHGLLVDLASHACHIFRARARARAYARGCAEMHDSSTW